VVIEGAQSKGSLTAHRKVPPGGISLVRPANCIVALQVYIGYGELVLFGTKRGLADTRMMDRWLRFTSEVAPGPSKGIEPLSGIFISYRRSDISTYAAGRLYDALARRFGRDRVFMDIDSLKGYAGLDFSQALDRAVTTCDVMIALIGPAWTTPTDAAGVRRLDDPEDWVRQEIATALARSDIRVIPVLMGEASMPKAAELPEPLKPLARRQKHEISDSRWDYDVSQLIDNVLAPLIDKPIWQPNRRVLAWSLVAVAASGSAVGAAVWLNDDDPDPPGPTPDPTGTQMPAEPTSTQAAAGEATETDSPPTLGAAPGDFSIEQDFIPVSNLNLPGETMVPTYITVHETDVPNSNASAMRQFVQSEYAQELQISFHWVVDFERAIQLLPHREVAWHTGTDEGNTTSIGVSACVFSDPERQATTRRNLASLLASLIRENDNADFAVQRVVPHQHWADKHCPATILDDGYWDTLIDDMRRQV